MTWSEIHRIDQLVTLEINSWDSPVTDPLWQFFSNIPVWIPMYVAIVALLIWKLGWKKGLIVTLAAVLTFGFCDQFSNIIKAAVGRIRPLNDAFMLENGLKVLEKGTRSFSFFSAHSANAFGLAMSTLTGFRAVYKRYSRPKWLKAYTIWMLTWASLVAVSRVFVGKHYLGDVLTGAIIGAIAGIFFGLLAKLIIDRYFNGNRQNI